MPCKPCLSRRTFIGRTSAALALPVLSSGCADHDVDRLVEDVQIDLSAHPQLQTVGETVMVDVEMLALPLAITRVGDEPDALLVNGTECNHRGCGVQRSGEGFRCPCHGAKFDIDGALRSGPATEGLIAYDFELSEDGVLTVFGDVE